MFRLLSQNPARNPARGFLLAFPGAAMDKATLTQLLEQSPWLAPGLAGGSIGLARELRRYPTDTRLTLMLRAVGYLAQALFVAWLADGLAAHVSAIPPATAPYISAVAALMGKAVLDIGEDAMRRWLRRKADGLAGR